MQGPDSSLAWCVALAACFINFVTAGIGRMSGILYVAFIDMFGISRGLATAPFSIRSSIRNLLGPVIGILAQHYGIRTVMVTGGLIGLFSSASCFWAYDMNWIIIVWGGINGVSVACTSTLPQVVVAQYFKKHLTTAAGLAISGACVGSFIFPVLIEFLLNYYGLQGTFLLMAAISMHVIPAAMLLRKPPWLRSNSKQTLSSIENGDTKKNCKNEKQYHAKSHDQISVRNETLPSIEENESNSSSHVDPQFNFFQDDREIFPDVIYEAMKFLNLESKYEFNLSISKNGMSSVDKELTLIFLDKMYHVALEKRNLEKRKSFDKEIQNICASTEFTNKVENAINLFHNESVLKDFVSHLEKGESSFVKSQSISKVLTVIFELGEVHKLYEKAICTTNEKQINVYQKPKQDKNEFHDSKREIEKPNTTKDTNHNQGIANYMKTVVKLNSQPVFVLICICRALHFMTFNPVLTAVVDFSLDKGFPEEYGKYIIAALSAGDLVGRLCTGWITDRKYLTFPRFMTVTMIIQGITTASLPYMDARWAVITMIGVFGFLEGAIYVRHPVLLSKYIKREDQPIAMGCLNFLTGLIGFGVPAYIGYFRDTLGAYDRMFYLTGGLGIFVGLAWLFERQLVNSTSYLKDENMQAIEKGKKEESEQKY